MISFDVNNGGALFLEQRAHDAPVRVERREGDYVDRVDIIGAGDMVMLLNLYRYVKDNDIQNDFINPEGKNRE